MAKDLDKISFLFAILCQAFGLAESQQKNMEDAAQSCKKNMKDYLIHDTGDLFEIENRLKEIDDGYLLFYNTKEQRYEVHNTKQRVDSFAAVCPYPKVDNRLVEYIRRTRCERAEKLVSEYEEHNKKLEEKQKKETISNIKDVIVDINKAIKKHR